MTGSEVFASLLTALAIALIVGLVIGIGAAAFYALRRGLCGTSKKRIPSIYPTIGTGA